MGARGPLPKSPERRQRRNKPPALRVIDAAGDVPPAPDGFLASTKRQWDEFWASDLAGLIDQAQRPQVERLFWLRDELERARRAVTKQGRLVRGSQGQPVLNPLLKYIETVLREVRALEDRLGLSPRAKLQIGGAMLDAQQSLHELNRTMMVADDDEDPRLIEES